MPLGDGPFGSEVLGAGVIGPPSPASPLVVGYDDPTTRVYGSRPILMAGAVPLGARGVQPTIAAYDTYFARLYPLMPAFSFGAAAALPTSLPAQPLVVPAEFSFVQFD